MVLKRLFDKRCHIASVDILPWHPSFFFLFGEPNLNHVVHRFGHDLKLVALLATRVVVA